MVEIRDPRVGVVRDRIRQPGISSLADVKGALALEDCTLSEALSHEWDCDAHLVQYHALDEVGTAAFLRINKRCAAPQQIRDAGGDVRVSTILLDYDLHSSAGSKRPWTGLAEVEEFLSIVARASVAEPTAFYTTKNGARFVFVLNRDVTVGEAEGLMRGLIRDYRAAGVMVDRTCKDWTRLFRLPRVERDGSRTEHAPAFTLLIGGPVLDVGSVVPEAGAIEEDYGESVNVDFGPLPDREACRQMLEIEGGKNSEWYKTARRYLRGRDCYPYIFEHSPVEFPRGTRNDTLMRMISSTIGLLHSREQATPSRVYALFDSVVDQLEPDQDTPDWRLAAWDLTCRLWGMETAKVSAARTERAERVEDAQGVMGQLLRSARDRQPLEPELSDDSRARRWIERRLIAAASRGFYVMQRDGSYAPTPVGKDRLVAMIRHLGMDEVIRTTEMRNEVWRTRDAQSLLDEYGIPVRRVECSPTAPYGHLRGDDADRVLVLRVHELRDLRGRYDAQVDQWLRYLFGIMYPECIEWLSHCLDVTGGICALVLVGASGTGKGMLVQGIAENFKFPRFNDGRALGRFNVGLLENPVVCMDEGISKTTSEGRHVSEVIRSMTVGGNLAIEAKGQDTIHAHIYPRLMVTANSLDVLSPIVGERDLSEQDILALETRMLVVPIDDSSRRWLTSHGNYTFTRGWVEGSGPSEYRVARHVRHLFETRQPSVRGSGRLLVEGYRSIDLLREFSLRTPTATAIVRALTSMIEDGSSFPGFYIDPDLRVFVVPHAVVRWYELHLQRTVGTEVSVKSAAKILRKVSMGQSFSPRRLNGQGADVEKQRWWELHLEPLLHEAITSGYPRSRLRELYRRRHGDEALAGVESSFEGLAEVRHEISS